MSRLTVMPREKRIERKAQVLKMRDMGVEPSAIALRTGLSRKRVSNILTEDSRAKGAWHRDAPHQMWEADEDARRKEIIKRAAMGARAALQMSSSQ